MLAAIRFLLLKAIQCHLSGCSDYSTPTCHALAPSMIRSGTGGTRSSRCDPRTQGVKASSGDAALLTAGSTRESPKATRNFTTALGSL